MSVTTGSIESINEVPLDIKLRQFYDEEEADMIVMEFCQDLMKEVMNRIETKMLTIEAQNFVVNCSLKALNKIIEVYYCFHNVSYTDMGEKSWQPDEACEPSPSDSWAAYRAPVAVNKKVSDFSMEHEICNNIVDDKLQKTEVEEILTPAKVLTSTSSSSQDDYSIIDYLEDLLSTSTSGEETEIVTSGNKVDQDQSETSGRLSEKLSAKLSQLSEKISQLENSVTAAKASDQDRLIASVFSKTALGESEKGLCFPHVGNLLVSNVVKDSPDIEGYTIVKVDKRKTKVSKKALVNNLPRRRSDTKVKMSNFVEEPQKKQNKK